MQTPSASEVLRALDHAHRVHAADCEHGAIEYGAGGRLVFTSCASCRAGTASPDRASGAL